MSTPLARSRVARIAAALAVAGLALTGVAATGAQGGATVPAAASGSDDLDRQHLDDVDNRDGSVAPSAAAKSRVNALGARVVWNKYGTPASLINYGGYLAQGLSKNEVTAARSFVSTNRALFRLSPTGVGNLEVLNDSRMEDSAGHAVLFRQTFGGLPATEDGLITVGVVDGKVAYVSSSAVGDGNNPGAATISAKTAWLKAAENVGLDVVATDVLEARPDRGWTTFSVDGVSVLQRARLVALPTPTDGVKAAYETVVYEGSGGREFAFTVFVDARGADAGEVLYRHNRLNHLSSMPTAQPTTGFFAGAYTPTTCGPRHPIETNADTKTISAAATATVPGNDIVINILRNGVVVGGPGDTGASPEFSTYDEGGTPLTGIYEVEVCPFDPNQFAPTTYQGAYVTSDVFPSSELVPRWKYFLNNPPLNNNGNDTRRVGCFTGADGQTDPNRTLPPGCQREEGNIAARMPWDTNPLAPQNPPTFTTRGNAAQTAEAWLSPLTPAENYSPIAPNRRYVYPFEDEWNDSTNPASPGKTGCSPTVFAGVPTTPGVPIVSATANDIEASITSLFASHNRMHDWSYFLGFTENNYNMQVSNFGNGDPRKANDPEVGNAQAGAVTGGFPSFMGRDNANQITLNDGIPGITNMYLWQPLPGAFYASCTDGDFDMSVIGHEYTHAISNRMVGGADAGLSSGSDGMARAMGESYSDLTAVEYLNEFDYVPTADENPFAVGPYVTGSDEKGIRNYGMNASPLNFSDIQGYDGSGIGSPHDDGEIWSAVNYQIRQAMIAKYNGGFPASSNRLQERCANGILPADKCPGNRRWMQTVFDAYLLMAPDVSMLDSRDAYLAADLMRYGGGRPGPDNQKLLWDTFASRGFGEFASTDATGTDDPQPTPNFASPESTDEATVRFRYVDVNGNALNNTTTYVGDYEGRISPIADTKPGTALDDTAKFVPGVYDLVVQAPGYGLTRITRTFRPNATQDHIRNLLLKNHASAANGATITGDGANLESLIDDTEATNYVSGTSGGLEGSNPDPAAPMSVRGRQVTVNLAGPGQQLVDIVKVSALLRSNAPDQAECEEPAPGCDPQDLSQSRFSALRQFAVEVCIASAGNAQCANRSTFANEGPGWDRIFTSADDAFPASVPRPLSPDLILRSFDVPDRQATHVRMVVLDNQCTGNPEYQGDQDADPTVDSDCRASSAEFPFSPDEVVLAPQNRTVRAAEFQVFSAGGDGGGGGGTPQDPFVAFTKTGPALADQGETITYTLDYANLGPAASDGAKITDKLPAGVSFVGATGPDSYNAGTRTVTWNLGSVGVLQDGSVELRVRVAPGVDSGTLLTNQAEFSGALTTATPALAATLIL